MRRIGGIAEKKMGIEEYWEEEGGGRDRMEGKEQKKNRRREEYSIRYNNSNKNNITPHVKPQNTNTTYIKTAPLDIPLR